MVENISREEKRQLYHQPTAGEKTFIPAKPKADIHNTIQTLRVCAYCRVSTDSDEQLSSFEFQQAHYKQLTESHPNWHLKHIYADEGISGTSLKKREQFNAMIAACEAGEYDLIVTKNVSRFARNIVDCVSLVRKLKQQDPPVGVFFETDNLYTLSEDSELMLSFLATFAQEESVKKSESMNWSLRQRFKDGKLLTPALLGYERPKDVTGRYIKYAKLQIIESEAEIVRLIFNLFLAGRSTKDIATFLTDIQCPTKSGNTKWSEGSIYYILSNERYCGNVLTWKTFTADMYEHKHRKNRQDRDQYLYSGHHDAIIPLETFEAAQVLLANRKHHIRGRLPTMQVIEEGIFRGFIPVNHHWINDNPYSYYNASNRLSDNRKARKIRRSQFSAFNLEGYQVVRSQFLSIGTERPCLSIGSNRISFNTQCAFRFIDVPYIQLLLHPSERTIAIRPCAENSAHSIRWRPEPGRPVKQKTLSCPFFGNALFQIMEWDPDYRYHIRGTWIKKGTEQIIVFDLNNAIPTVTCSKGRRMDYIPEEWNDTFGKDFYEHRIQNGLFYGNSQGEWNSQADSIPLPDETHQQLPPDEEIQISMEKLKRSVESKHGA